MDVVHLHLKGRPQSLRHPFRTVTYEKRLMPGVAAAYEDDALQAPSAA